MLQNGDAHNIRIPNRKVFKMNIVTQRNLHIT